MAERQALLDENANLMAQIAALKNKLGISPLAEEKRKQELRDLFNMFDTDGNGVIDREEFAVVAFEAGADVRTLSHEALNEAFAQLANTQFGEEKMISFEDFWSWHRAEKPAVAADSNSPLGLLSLKLRGKSLLKSVQTIKSATGITGDEKGESKQVEEKKSEPESKLIDIQFGVGHFEEARGGFTLSGFADKTRADQIKSEVKCPEEIKFFAFVDVELQPEADEMKVYELIGMIETIFDSLGVEGMIPGFHSRTVDLHETADDGPKYIRLAVFCSLDPMAIMAAMATAESDDNAKKAITDVFSANLALELPISLEDFVQDKDKTIATSDLQFRLKIDFTLDSALVEASEAILDKLPPGLQHTMKTKLAIVKFIKGLKWHVTFDDLDTAVSEAGDNLPKKLQHSLAAMSKTPVWEGLTKPFLGLAPLMAQQADLFNLVKELTKGVAGLTILVDSHVTEVKLIGASFVPFLPDVPAS